MKKILFLSCAALLALGSCTSDLSDDGFVDKANSISFSAYTNKLRYTNGDADLAAMKTDKFGVVGYYNNNLYLGAGDKAAAQDYTNGTSWEYSDLTELKYWPAGSMDFYAYFPYAGSGDVFANSNGSGTVMTIAATSADKDVLFAYTGGQAKIDRVPLQFHHAFSKIQTLNITMPSTGTLYKSKTQVEVKGIEFVNTVTKGNVLVNNTGKASYSGANTTRSKELTDAITIKQNTPSELTNNTHDFVTSTDNAYLFATNGAETNNVIGTNKTLWDGTKAGGSAGTLASGTLDASGLVFLKLKCKVWNGTNTYYVGSAAADDYGYVYIPLTGAKTSATPDVAPFLAGKRYTINIIWNDNVGYDNNGESILTPILFNVSGVDAWGDVTITITL